MTEKPKNRKPGILFLCTGNSCRSQMAEGFAKAMVPEYVKVYSAGTSPIGLNANAVYVMKEAGIDISNQYSKKIEDIPANKIGTVITVCGNAEKSCPSFPGDVRRLHWPIPDPAIASGDKESILQQFRTVRDIIRNKIEEFFKDEEANNE